MPCGGGVHFCGPGWNGRGLSDPVSRECSQDTAGFQEGLLRRGGLLAQTDGVKVHLIPNLKNKPSVQTEQWGQSSSIYEVKMEVWRVRVWPC